jgi:uncharacterized protein (TIGR02145 family)
MKKLLNIYNLLIILLLTGIFLTTCTKDSQDQPSVVQQSHPLGALLLPESQYAKIPAIQISGISMKSLAASVNLNTPPVVNQGSEGSCVAFGTTYAGRSIMWKKNHTTSSYSQSVNIFSPEYVYNQTKVSTSCASGSYVTSALNLLKSQGVCRWSVMPYVDGDCSTLPNQSQTTDASSYKIIDYGTVAIDLMTIKAQIASGIPVIVAGPVYTNFDALKEGEVLKAVSGTSRGSHCYCVIGYDDAKNAFKFQNSWGTTAWTTSGYGWIDYAYITDWWKEAYVIIDKTATMPTLTTKAVSSLTSTSAISGGNITSNGGVAITASGVCWSTTSNPTIALSTKTNDVTASGSYSSNITGLTANTKYYVRAYATNSAGTGYGTQVSFTTSKAVVPNLTTTTPSSITSNSAASGGNITSNGGVAITVSGVCWSTNSNPTVSLSTKTTNSITIGSFTGTITGLTPNTTYYVRAYSTNSVGTGYGAQVSFKTLAEAVTVTDIDGNKYKVVVIGTQTWMAENLKTTKYNDGTTIPNVTAVSSWSALTTGAYCDYANTPSYSATYGRLYNWYTSATTNTKNVCPTGWHVPSDAEWTILTNYLGGANVAGGMLKEIGLVHWQTPNTSATNSTGFTALPSGTRNYLGTYASLLTYGCWWSGTEGSTTSLGWYQVLAYNNGTIVRSDGIGKKAALSIRCIKTN